MRNFIFLVSQRGSFLIEATLFGMHRDIMNKNVSFHGSRKSQCHRVVEVQTEFGTGDCWLYQSLRGCIPKWYVVWGSRNKEDVLCIQGYSCVKRRGNIQEIQGHLGRHDQ